MWHAGGMSPAGPRTVSIVLFDGFELLDVFGPLELLSRLPDAIQVQLVGPRVGAVASSQGTQVLADEEYEGAAAPDIVMVPGGRGTRALVRDRDWLEWLSGWAGAARLVTSVCTGSAVLAAAGLLEGYRATSNKLAFEWARGHGSHVEWVASARWVHDRDRWTSSGVAAGMDMAGALIADLFGADAAARAAREIEVELQQDPTRDPFAALSGLR